MSAGERHTCNLRWNGYRLELKYLTAAKKGKRGEGGSQRVGKCSQISDRQELHPQREAITEGWRGNGEACHWAYWQSVSKATARRGGIFLSRDRKMPARNEKSTLLRIPGNEGDMWSGWVVKGSTADRARGLEDRGEKRWGQNLKWHFFFFCHYGNVPPVGLPFKWSALREREGEVIRGPESDRGHGAQYDEITKRGSRMEGKYIRRCDYVFLEENYTVKQSNKIEPISSGCKVH